MADLSTKKDPLNLKNERADYTEDVSGGAADEGAQPHAGTDPMSLPTEGIQKPTVHLDEEKVRQHDREIREARD
ncbi:MAG: hypothetical protein HKN04_00670 [Rhodothermaceae bacterium]|nr:hypothetical protein [Rhodothermaceae bacterium]